MAWLLFSKLYSDYNINGLGVNRTVTFKNFVVCENFSNRFSDDKIISSVEDSFFVLDGVLLNKQELYHEFTFDSLDSLISNFIQNKNFDFFSLFRGPFTGCHFDSSSNSLYAYGNQTGDTAIYYYKLGEKLVVSSDFNLIFNFCKNNDICLTLNENAAINILTYGFLIEDNTVSGEIKRVKPGECLKITDYKCELFVYHRFHNVSEKKCTLSDASDIINISFRKAVKRCLDKDLEYGFSNHLIDISGGLDSRMVNFVAKELGYKNITNISYSKNGSDESLFAYQTSMFLGNEYLFKPLDDLNFFYDVEDNVKMNFGSALYNGITGGKSLLSSLNFNKFGLEHTGMLGDVIIGSFCSSPLDIAKDPTRIGLSDLIIPSYLGEEYDNHEIFSMYTRGFQAAVTTHFLRRNYTEIVSAFIDVDFLQTCFLIPLEHRCKHKLYWEWISKYYPQAAKIPSTRIRQVNRKISLRSLGLSLVSKNKRQVIRILKKLKLYNLVQSPNDMNPMNFWYDTTPEIQEFYKKYYDDRINLLNNFPLLKKNVELLFTGEKQFDKSLAITVLGIVSVYFNKK
jgi:asparagine synthase (glutamine-hydrolysing)